MQVIWCLKFCNVTKSGEDNPPLQILGGLSLPSPRDLRPCAGLSQKCKKLYPPGSHGKRRTMTLPPTVSLLTVAEPQHVRLVDRPRPVDQPEVLNRAADQ